MRALVIGAGRMGRAAAWDLARQPDVAHVALADRDPLVLEDAAEHTTRLAGAVGSRAAISARAFDLDEARDPAEKLADFDVVLSAADYRAEAELAKITVIPDCGLAPGLACILAAGAVERLGSAHWIKIRVGGLPAHPRPPLNYKIVFSVRGITNQSVDGVVPRRGLDVTERRG